MLEKVERESVAVRDAIVGDATLMARTKDVGVLTNGTARSVCVVGPPARASGVRHRRPRRPPLRRLRRDPRRIAVHQEGDTWARVLVRVEELLESIRLVREALAALPDGPILTEVKEEIPPGRVGISVVEAPRGEAVHYVLTGGDNRPYRWRVRAPTLPEPAGDARDGGRTRPSPTCRSPSAASTRASRAPSGSRRWT